MTEPKVGDEVVCFASSSRLAGMHGRILALQDTNSTEDRRVHVSLAPSEDVAYGVAWLSKPPGTTKPVGWYCVPREALRASTQAVPSIEPLEKLTNEERHFIEVDSRAGEFVFVPGQRVHAPTLGEGVVVARAETLIYQRSYLVRSKDATGREIADWVDENAVFASNRP